MKRLLSLGFILILFAQVGGFYIFFVARLAQLHEQSRELLETLPLEKLERIELSDAAYKKARVNNREIKLLGKMYDIGRLERINGQIIIYAEHDEAEDNLFAFLKEVIEQTTRDDKPVPLYIHQLTELVYLHSNVLYPTILATTPIHHCTRVLLCVGELVLRLPTPPPKG